MQTTKISETIYRFSTFWAAKSFADRAVKIWLIILGDDEKFWVVTPTHAAKLLRQGYELAE